MLDSKMAYNRSPLMTGIKKSFSFIASSKEDGIVGDNRIRVRSDSDGQNDRMQGEDVFGQALSQQNNPFDQISKINQKIGITSNNSFKFVQTRVLLTDRAEKTSKYQGFAGSVCITPTLGIPLAANAPNNNNRPSSYFVSGRFMVAVEHVNTITQSVTTIPGSRHDTFPNSKDLLVSQPFSLQISPNNLQPMFFDFSVRTSRILQKNDYIYFLFICTQTPLEIGAIVVNADTRMWSSEVRGN